MLFPTVEFAAFFVVVLLTSWLLMHRRTGWKVFITVASYLFYAAWDWRYTLLLAANTIATQLAAQAMGRAGVAAGDREADRVAAGDREAVQVAAGDRDAMQLDQRRRRRALVAGLVANLGVLAWFKYYGFFVSSANNLLSTIGIDAPLPLLNIVLPVGISFFTFQAMSYLIDVYRGHVEVASWLDIFVYQSFFPQLVAGPIVRGSEFLPQLRTRRDPRAIPAGSAFGLILAGLFKKVVIASALGTGIVDPVFSSPDSHSGLVVLIGIYAYAVQIYADFSGYTDIAIGIALLLGFQFPQNFNAPYTALSLRDFWRRWHMTLSRWLRDYLYIPLGGSHGGAARTMAALLTTMVLGGLWHGAAWTFVIWGAFHGAGLAVERLLGQAPTSSEGMSGVEVAVRRLVTFHVVCLGWVFFRSPTLGSAFDVLGALTNGGPTTLVTPAILLSIAIGIGFQYVPKDVGERLEVRVSTLHPVTVGLLLGAGLLVVGGFGPEGIAPFIYFQF